MKRTYFFLIIVLLTSGRLTAQEWVVPAENAAKRSPFAFTDSIRQAGAALYMTTCKSCHGDPGKNNTIKLVPPPPDPASAQMQKNSDGDMFYKLTTGRGPMPSFKNTLSSTDMWRIISFIRSSNDKYVQELAPSLAPGSTLDQVRFLVSMIKGTNQVQVQISSLKDKIRQPVANAEVKLFARRYFGNLMIDEAHISDNQGIALFKFPANLPGDAKGYVELIAKPTDEVAFGEAKADTTLAIGVPNNRPPLNEQRALWNVVQKTPIWLLLTYTFSVLAVWGLIVYVLLQVRAIFKSGSEEKRV
jgi:mono/diheme cytochrome c family protein